MEEIIDGRVVALNVNAFPVKHCVNEGEAVNAGEGPAGVVMTIEAVAGHPAAFVTVCKTVYVVEGAKLTTLVEAVVVNDGGGPGPTKE